MACFFVSGKNNWLCIFFLQWAFILLRWPNSLSKNWNLSRHLYPMMKTLYFKQSDVFKVSSFWKSCGFFGIIEHWPPGDLQTGVKWPGWRLAPQSPEAIVLSWNVHSGPGTRYCPKWRSLSIPESHSLVRGEWSLTDGLVKCLQWCRLFTGWLRWWENCEGKWGCRFINGSTFPASPMSTRSQ